LIIFINEFIPVNQKKKKKEQKLLELEDLLILSSLQGLSILAKQEGPPVLYPIKAHE
jgi:hypothetical protein